MHLAELKTEPPGRSPRPIRAGVPDKAALAAKTDDATAKHNDGLRTTLSVRLDIRRSFSLLVEFPGDPVPNSSRA
jgi:hypothetical protein